MDNEESAEDLWSQISDDDYQDLQEEGIRNLDNAVSQHPDSFDPYVFRGFVARELQGDLDLAIRMYELALDHNPPPAMRTQLKATVEEMRSDLDLVAESR